MLTTRILLIGAVLPALASAQAFNIDVGSATAINGAGPPSSAYGAAPGQVGMWHDFDSNPLQGVSNYSTGTFTDINGNPTPVTADFDVVNPNDTFTNLDFNAATTMGDDGLLMDDIVYCIGGPYDITFRNLQPGIYAVYTYAMAPDSATLFSRVDVPAGTGGPQDVGGTFPAAGHQLGISYAEHTVLVDASGILVINMDQNPDDSLNGIQLVPGGSVGIGTSYCGPAPANSTGAPGVITALGSPVALDNNVTLTASALPTNQFGIFITSLTQGFIPMPGGSMGNLCVTGPGRFNGPGQVQNSGAGGTFSLMIDLTMIPTPTGPVAVFPGETRSFQAWYRDLSMGVPTSNFTDGREVTFQ